MRSRLSNYITEKALEFLNAIIVTVITVPACNFISDDSGQPWIAPSIIFLIIIYIVGNTLLYVI